MNDSLSPAPPRVRVALAHAILVALGAHGAHAQIRTEWSASPFADVSSLSEGQRVARAASGAIHAAGLISGSSTDSLAVAQIDAAGTVSWTATVPALAKPVAVRDIAVSSTGRTAVAGIAGSPHGLGTHNGRTLLASFAPDGSLEWMHVGAPAVHSSLESVAFDAVGNVVVGGAQGTTGVVRKYDPQGVLRWETTPSGACRIHSLALGSGGDIHAVALLCGAGAIATRLDASSGSALWSTVIEPGSHSTDWYRCLVVPGDAMVVSGRFSSGVSSAFGAQQVDAQGSVAWLRPVPGLAPSGLELPLTRDLHGRIVLAGSRYLGTSRAFQAAVLDPTGQVVWSEEITAPGTPSSTGAVVVTDDSAAIYEIGIQNSSSGTPTAGVVGCFDASGMQRFVWHSHAANPSMYARQLFAAVADSSGIVVVGILPSIRFGVQRLRRTAVPVCLGDGSSGACPCGNPSASAGNAGCLNSLGAGGRLVDAGASSLSGDTLTLEGSSMPNAAVLYFQGTQLLAGGAGAPFGDGLRCVAGTLTRLGVKTNVAGASRYPDAGDSPISVRGMIPGPGTIAAYQAWYRNSASFCTSAAFNMTNALRVVWTD